MAEKFDLKSKDLPKFIDGILCANAHGPLKINITDEELDLMERFVGDSHFIDFYSNYSITMLFSSEMRRFIVNQMKSRIEGETEVRFVLLSGQDVSVSLLLTSLGFS